MEISTGHHQAMASHELDHQLLNRPKSSSSSASPAAHHLQPEKKARPPPEQALRCPRCDSTNTKFCYYNNYSLSQPRYFCKGCRRYWTKGGSLRNVPVGGGCRKNKRSSPPSTSTSSTSSKKAASHDMNPTPLLLHSMPLPPALAYDPSDLSLAFSSFHSHDPFLLGNPNPNPNPNPNGPAFLDILRGGDHSGFYYGFGGGGGGDDIRGVLSFDSTAADAETVVVGNSDPGNSAAASGHGSLGMGFGRDYWNAVVGSNNSSWHGIINSSLL